LESVAGLGMGSRIVSPLASIARKLSRALTPLHFAPPTAYVYNPLVYARAPHELYLERYGRTPEILLLGMNPGPFGMAQTGVPFGEVSIARDWLGLEAHVDKPEREHPKRPITGFACTRSEVSGARLWGWAKRRFATPDAFFARFFVVNYCPLVFMEESGANRTPDKLPAAECDPLYAACDRALLETVVLLKPRLVVGIGAFAEARAMAALSGTGVEMGRILHPSPASPLANKDWAGQAEKQLRALGIQM